jgi:hypothetical protein
MLEPVSTDSDIEKFVHSTLALLKEKYPTVESCLVPGFSYDACCDNKRSYRVTLCRSYTILIHDFRISCNGTTVVVSKPTPLAHLQDSHMGRLFECFVDTSEDGVNFDLTEPGSIERLLAHVDELIQSRR